MRVAVAVASLGRKRELRQFLDVIKLQTQPPALVILSLEDPADAPEDCEGAELLFGSRGSCIQRNRVMDAVGDRADVIVFYDDDFVPSRYALSGISRLFAGSPEIVGATGLVLADGITSGGIHHAEATRLVEAYDSGGEKPQFAVDEVRWAYGCNMAFRITAIAGVRFDERLPLYGWQEDVDFAYQLLQRGRMVITDVFAGVHCGATSARSPGRRLGYSQIVNPMYLVRKGTMRKGHALRIMMKNLAANHMRAVAPESHIDRRGRMVGNWIGLGHLLTGRADPMYILKL